MWPTLEELEAIPKGPLFTASFIVTAAHEEVLHGFTRKHNQLWRSRGLQCLPQVCWVNSVCPGPSANESASTLEIPIDIIPPMYPTSLSNSARNIAPISRVPSEVLSGLIFLYCADGPQFPPQASATKQAWPFHLVLSQVCRRWRDLALNTPCLWTVPDFSSSELASLMLERSGNRPISISVNNALPKNLLKALRASSSRIRDLHFSGASALSALTKLKLGHSLPLLESFHADTTAEQRALVNSCWPAGKTPRLTHVKLVHCLVPWDSACLSNLTSLTIHSSQQLNTRSATSVSNILQMLARNPRLKNLDLRTLVTSRSMEPLAATRGPIILKHLAEFFLDDTMAHQSWILSAIRAPQMNNLQMQNLTIPREHRRGDFSTLCRSLLTFLDDDTLPILDALSVLWQTTYRTSSKRPQATVLICGRFKRSSDSQDKVVQISLPHVMRELATIGTFIAAQMSLLPLQDLTCISLEHVREKGPTPPLGHERNLWNCLASLPRPRTLMLKGMQTLGIPAQLLSCITIPYLPPGDSTRTDSGTFPSLLDISCLSRVCDAFDNSAWETALASMVTATQSRRAAAVATPRVFLHQQWFSKASGCSGSPATAAKVCIRDGKVQDEWDQ